MANEVRVILADASEEFRILLKDTIEETGEFRVVGSTGDGEELVRMAAQLQPQLVIMDVVLPGLDGFGVLSRLQAMQGGIDVHQVFGLFYSLGSEADILSSGVYNAFYLCHTSCCVLGGCVGHALQTYRMLSSQWGDANVYFRCLSAAVVE